MVKHKCHKFVTKGEFGRAVPCSRPGTIADDKVPDRWWCVTHSPAGKAARTARREKRYQQFSAEQDHKHALHRWNAKCVTIVEQIAKADLNDAPILYAEARAHMAARPKLSTDKA